MNYKKLSFTFNAECMVDVFGILSLFKTEVILRGLHGLTIQTGVFGDVEVVLVFCFYESTPMSSFIASITAALEAMEKSNLELHVANETLNFSDEYDGERTYSGGEQREDLIPRIAEKLDAIAFSTFTI